MRDYEILLASCLFWLGVGWTIGRFGKEERKRRKQERRLKRLTKRTRQRRY